MAIAVVSETLESRSADARQAALTILLRLVGKDNENAFEEVRVRCSTHSMIDVRLFSVEALVALTDASTDRCAAALKQLLNDVEMEVRLCAAEAIESLTGSCSCAIDGSGRARQGQCVAS